MTNPHRKQSYHSRWISQIISYLTTDLHDRNNTCKYTSMINVSKASLLRFFMVDVLFSFILFFSSHRNVSADLCWSSDGWNYMFANWDETMKPSIDEGNTEGRWVFSEGSLDNNQSWCLSHFKTLKSCFVRSQLNMEHSSLKIRNKTKYRNLLRQIALTYTCRQGPFVTDS